MANWGQVTYVRFGSLAALHRHSSATAAIGRIAVIRQQLSWLPNLNVRFHQKQSLTHRDYRLFERQLSARSGRL
jgi:hypothetical protein